MDLEAHWTDLGLMLKWPGGRLVLTNVQRVQLATPHGLVTFAADGTNWPAQPEQGHLLDPAVATWLLPSTTERAQTEVREIERTVSSGDYAEVFDPMEPGVDLADSIAFVMTQPDVELPVYLDDLEVLLKNRTAVSLPKNLPWNLERAMGGDARFRKIPGNTWTLAVTPRSAVQHGGAALSEVAAVGPAQSKPSDIELFLKEFDPKVPGGKVADYAFFLMAQPSVALPMLLSDLLKLLKVHTAANASKETKSAVNMQLAVDPRFQRADGWRWELASPLTRPELKSAIDYIVEVVGQPDVKLPTSLSALVQLLERRTDIGPPRCGVNTLHYALLHDARFYRVEREIWTLKRTPHGS